MNFKILSMIPFVYLYASTLVFILLLIIILTFIETEKIKVIGDFLKKIMPVLPISAIIKLLKG